MLFKKAPCTFTGFDQLLHCLKLSVLCLQNFVNCLHLICVGPKLSLNFMGMHLLVCSAHPEVRWVGCPWLALPCQGTAAHLCNSYTWILTLKQSILVHKPLLCNHDIIVVCHLHKASHFTLVPSAREGFSCRSSICFSFSTSASIGYKIWEERKLMTH